MTSYRLTDEPCLPVLHAERGHVRVSLIEAFEQSDEIVGVDSPFRAAEIQHVRLLAAIASDAMRSPEVPDELDVPVIVEYLREHERRFDLGGEEAFYQDHDLIPDEPSYPTTLIKTFHSGEGMPAAFGRRQSHLVDSVPSEEILDHLMAAVAWNGGGLTSIGPPDGKGGYARSAKAGPLAGSIAHLPVGRTLAETILMNLPDPDGAPAWADGDHTGMLAEITVSSLAIRLWLSEDGRSVIGAKVGRATTAHDAEAGLFAGGPAMPRDPALAWTIPSKPKEVSRRVSSPRELGGSESLHRSLSKLHAAEEPEVVRRAKELASELGWPAPRVLLYSMNGVGTAAASIVSVDEIPAVPTSLRRASSGSVIETLDAAIWAIGRSIEGGASDRNPGGSGSRSSFVAACRGPVQEAYRRSVEDPSLDAVPEDIAEPVRTAALRAVRAATSGMDPMDAAWRAKSVRQTVAKRLPAPQSQKTAH